MNHAQNQSSPLPKFPNYGHVQPLTSSVWEWTKDGGFDHGLISTPCPYGVAGDRLWVRERWKYLGQASSEFPQSVVSYSSDNAHRIIDGHYPIAKTWYREGDIASIHMPRWASRITLQILKVRVERLQEISEEDAKAEGATKGIIAPDGSFLIREERGLATYGQRL